MPYLPYLRFLCLSYDRFLKLTIEISFSNANYDFVIPRINAFQLKDTNAKNSYVNIRIPTDVWKI